MSTIQVGDRNPYIIRDWDSVARQFGLSSGGNVKTRGRYFRRHEKYMCGRTVFINSKPKNNVYIVQDSIYTYRYYYVSEDMLELLFVEPDDDLNGIKTQDFEKILGVTA